MGMVQEFKEFAIKGNVMDMAVGVIIGAEFGKIVNSMVADLIMPPIGMLVGKVSFNDLFVNLSDVPVASLAEAKAKGIATLNYGAFITTSMNFAILAFSVFLIVRVMNKLRANEAKAPEAK
jgi:large conductance mechanosensitive channel